MASLDYRAGFRWNDGTDDQEVRIPLPLRFRQGNYARAQTRFRSIGLDQSTTYTEVLPGFAEMVEATIRFFGRPRLLLRMLTAGADGRILTYFPDMDGLISFPFLLEETRGIVAIAPDRDRYGGGEWESTIVMRRIDGGSLEALFPDATLFWGDTFLGETGPTNIVNHRPTHGGESYAYTLGGDGIFVSESGRCYGTLQTAQEALVNPAPPLERYHIEFDLNFITLRTNGRAGLIARASTTNPEERYRFLYDHNDEQWMLFGGETVLDTLAETLTVDTHRCRIRVTDEVKALDRLEGPDWVEKVSTTDNAFTTGRAGLVFRGLVGPNVGSPIMQVIGVLDVTGGL